MKKGESKKIYAYTERDIARVAGVSIGAVRVAKVRRKYCAEGLKERRCLHHRALAKNNAKEVQGLDMGREKGCINHAFSL